MEPATSERIICRVGSILSTEGSNLGDFDIVYAPGDINVNPVVLVEGNVGLASWCVKHVYCHAYHNVLQHTNKIWRYEECESMCLWTQFCLLVRPEVATFWNLRRKLIKKGLISTSHELLLTKLIISRKAKCMEAFFQRQWLYDKMNASLEPNFIARERDLCSWAACRHQNNYHAWNHRLWLLKKILTFDQQQCLEVINEEFDGVKQWVSVHVSEHSGLHYINKLVDSTIQCSLAGKFDLSAAAPFVPRPRDVYEEMLNWNKSLIANFPGHEALFCARRSLMMKWRLCVEDCTTMAVSDEDNQSSNPSAPVNSSPPSSAGNHKRNNQNKSPNINSPEGKKHSKDTREGCCTQEKGDSESSSSTDSDLPATKRSCIENVCSDWSKFVLDEVTFCDTSAGDSEYCKLLVRQHRQAVARMGF